MINHPDGTAADEGTALPHTQTQTHTLTRTYIIYMRIRYGDIDSAPAAQYAYLRVVKIIRLRASII